MPHNKPPKSLTAKPAESTMGQAKSTEGETAVLAKFAAMPEPDRALGERLHAIIKANAPMLSPKLWYGMPAYAKDDKVVCFFRESYSRPATGRTPSVGAMRYVTFGFYDTANLDEDGFWPVSFALTDLTPAVEVKIAGLVKKAVF